MDMSFSHPRDGAAAARSGLRPGADARQYPYAPNDFRIYCLLPRVVCLVTRLYGETGDGEVPSMPKEFLVSRIPFGSFTRSMFRIQTAREGSTSRTASGVSLAVRLPDIGIPVQGVAQGLASGFFSEEKLDLALTVEGGRRPRVLRVLSEERLEFRAGLGVAALGTVCIGQQESRVGHASIVGVLRQESAQIVDRGLVALRGELRDRRGEATIRGPGREDLSAADTPD
jgi:hypothetical protein